jgi:hypothetical protein
MFISPDGRNRVLKILLKNFPLSEEEAQQKVDNFLEIAVHLNKIWAGHVARGHAVASEQSKDPDPREPEPP